MGLITRASRSVWRKKTRTLLIILLLAFSTATIMAVYTGIEASNANTTEMIDDYEDFMVEMGEMSEAQLLMITVNSGNKFGGMTMPGADAETTYLSSDQADIISELDGVEIVIPTVTKNVGDFDFTPGERPTGSRPDSGPGGGLTDLWDYVVQGIPINNSLLETYPLLPLEVVDGRPLQEGDVKMAYIGEGASDFFGVGVGNTVVIEGINFQIVGIFSSSYQDKNVYMSLSDAREVSGIDSGESMGLNIYAVNESVIDYIVNDIQALYSDYRTTAYRDFSATMTERMGANIDTQIVTLEDDMVKIESTGNTVMIISVISSGLVVLFLMLYIIKERTKEIGTLKALGFPEGKVMIQFILEGILIGIIGGLIGVVIGWVGSPFLSNLFLPKSSGVASAYPSVQITLIALGLMVALGGIGSIYPAWKASKKSPAEAMRYE